MRKITFWVLAIALVGCKPETKQKEKTTPMVELEQLKLPIISEDTIPKEKVVAKPDSSTTDTVKLFKKKPTTIPKEKSITASLASKFINKTVQHFVINTSKDTTIECKGGTKIAIAKNSFQTNNHKAVTGNVNLSVNEFNTLPNILLANLSTMSDDKILETGGMLYLEATANGETCTLKNDKKLQLYFPYQGTKKEMQLFYGTTKTDEVNWELAEENVGFVCTVSEVKPMYPGGDIAMKAFINKELKYPALAEEKGIKGRVIVRFMVAEDGSLLNMRASGAHSLLCKEAIRVVSKMPKWQPAQSSGSAVSTTLSLPFTFNMPIIQGIEYIDTMSTISKASLKQAVKKKDMSKVSTNALNYYIFSSAKLGWINCDRFYNDPSPKIDYVLKDQFKSNSQTMLVFHNIKAVMPSTTIGRSVTFYKVPLGAKVTLVSIQNRDEEYYLATKETTVSKDGITNLNYKPVTLELLEAKIAQLQDVWKQ